MDDSKTDRGGFRKGEVPLKRALQLADYLQNQLLSIAERAVVVGSVLRRKPVVGDIDLLILPKDLDQTIRALESEGFKGDNRIMRKMADGILVEIYIAHREKELGALKLYTTGDIMFVRKMRERAREFGLELTQYGLFNRKTRKLFMESPYERDFFEVLEVPWVPAPERNTPDPSRPALGDRYLPPQEWSPLWKKMTKAPNKELFKGVIWDLTPWRTPDYQDEGKSVWYGPDGKDGQEASVILYQDGGWAFGQYTGVEGVIDNPPALILSTFTFISFEELQRAVMEKSMTEVPVDAFERASDAWAPFAAAAGAVKLSYYGGQEEWIDQLP